VSIKSLPRAVIMEITDNGRAFDIAQVLDSRRNKRLGLIGMRERVEMVGGRFDIESAPGTGTIISARIPFIRS
jgi:signal transduction histidine kinase